MRATLERLSTRHFEIPKPVPKKKRKIQPKPIAQITLPEVTVSAPRSVQPTPAAIPVAMASLAAPQQKKPENEDNALEKFIKRTGQKLPIISFGTMLPLLLRSPKALLIGYLVTRAGFDIRAGVAYQNSAFFSKTGEAEYAGFSWKDMRGEIEIRMPSIVLGTLAAANMALMNLFGTVPTPENSKNPEFVRYKTMDFLNKAAIGTSIASWPLQKLAYLNPKNTHFPFSASKIKFSNSLWNMWNNLTGQQGDGKNRFQVGLSVDTDMFRTRAGRTTLTNGVEVRFDKEAPVVAYYTGFKQYINMGKYLPEAEINLKTKYLHQELLDGFNVPQAIVTE